MDGYMKRRKIDCQKYIREVREGGGWGRDITA